ncbi:MAG: YfiR family protein [Bryobacteraceae bacterium]
MAFLIQRGRGRTGRALFVPVALLLAARVPVAAQVFKEYEVKAAILYKFAGFVEWPAAPAGAPLCIGVLGHDPFGPALDQAIQGKSINGRPFVIQRFKTGQETGNCQIVFVSSSEKKVLRGILDRLRREPILTVGDTPGFCEDGGIVNLELADNRVHFQINPEAAELARLVVSSKLLSLAGIVHGGTQ